MLNWIFKNRSAERKDGVRSAADLVRDRRSIGMWNDPIPDYSRAAPNPMIRNRARFLEANSAVAARAVQAFVDNVVGPGITLLPKISGRELKAALLDTWNAWTDAADLDGLHNLYGLQALAARMMFIDGEVFVRFTTDTDGSLRLQLLPAEFIDTTITRDNVIAGIEFDESGRRIALYIYEWHPSGEAESRRSAHGLRRDAQRESAGRSESGRRRLDRKLGAWNHPAPFTRRV